MEKKFFWIKLKDKFFDCKEIRIIRSCQNGDKIVLIYLELVLSSIKNSGIIEYEGILETIEAEIGVSLNESTQDVIQAVSLLCKAGLLLKNDNSISVVNREELFSIGSECGSAKRVREYRKKQKGDVYNEEKTDGWDKQP